MKQRKFKYYKAVAIDWENKNNECETGRIISADDIIQNRLYKFIFRTGIWYMYIHRGEHHRRATSGWYRIDKPQCVVKEISEADAMLELL